MFRHPRTHLPTPGRFPGVRHFHFHRDRRRGFRVHRLVRLPSRRLLCRWIHRCRDLDCAVLHLLNGLPCENHVCI